jgi:hypothetical protein
MCASMSRPSWDRQTSRVARYGVNAALVEEM